MLSKVQASLNKAVDNLKGTKPHSVSSWEHPCCQTLSIPSAAALLGCLHTHWANVAVTAEKAAEVRAELGEHRPVSSTYQPEQQSAPAAPSTAPQELPADSRAQSLHLCGFDISGVSIAGQVSSTPVTFALPCQWPCMSAAVVHRCTPCEPCVL
jgi:hypothetical protein